MSMFQKVLDYDNSCSSLDVLDFYSSCQLIDVSDYLGLLQQLLIDHRRRKV